MNEMIRPGLADVIAGETAISCIDDGLSYRGYHIEGISKKASFEEAAYLVLYGKLPQKSELEKFSHALAKERVFMPGSLMSKIIETGYTYNTMDMLRTCISALGMEQRADKANEDAVRIIGVMPAILADIVWFQLKAIKKEPSAIFANTDSYARFLWNVMADDPKSGTEVELRAFEASLILYMDNEFNASTFAVRTCASTLTDMYSSVCAGIGALKGPLHGGANKDVAHMLLELEPRDPDFARRHIQEMLYQKKKIPGFGHRVYKTGDPRSKILREYCEELRQKNEKLVEVAWAIEDEMKALKPELPPNTDYYNAVLYLLFGIKIQFFTSLFAAARSVGWCAHYMEQRAQNKLIRPRAKYIGERNRDYPEGGR